MTEQILLKKTSSVLMVDDIPANLELLSVMLKVRGYKVRAAVSGEMALQAARNDPPDLILLDINMPEMNGYEVCRQLKADERLKDVPVIFLSALNETMDKVKAFGAGGVDFITKPFQFEEVEARVETHLELRRQKRQLQENYTRLRELESLRDSLVHMIIHDLRSPLAGIYGFLELIKESAKNTLSTDLLRYISEAMASAKQMARIVSDVLDTSKMEGGQMKLKLEECDLGSAVEESLSGLKSLYENREIRFKSPGRPAIVLADREIVLRIIQNLLANALKFTQDGGMIRLDIAPSAGGVHVSVRDNGPGIAPEFRQKIFEKFAQVDLPAGRQKNSTGLGLTFCKLAVEAHGGSIGVDSEEGQGSCFWFELPKNGPGPLLPAKN
ncbi:MAG: hybrid sensor histidine kinase/response regulator [Elusimicrobiota bacterium]|nr:hybrid sensor histidine kinase/response regulator [Elusimicrobiota bacterium]